MFKQIHRILANCKSVSIIVTGNGEKLTLTVMPTPKATGDLAAVLATPLQISGTPDELDTGLGDALSKYTVSHQSLSEQVDATLAVIEAAKKATTEKAAAAVTKAKTSSVKVVAPVALPPAVGGCDVGDDDEGGGNENGDSGSVVAQVVVSDNADLFA